MRISRFPPRVKPMVLKKWNQTLLDHYHLIKLTRDLLARCLEMVSRPANKAIREPRQ